MPLKQHFDLMTTDKQWVTAKGYASPALLQEKDMHADQRLLRPVSGTTHRGRCTLVRFDRRNRSIRLWISTGTFVTAFFTSIAPMHAD